VTRPAAATCRPVVLASTMHVCPRTCTAASDSDLTCTAPAGDEASDCIASPAAATCRASARLPWLPIEYLFFPKPIPGSCVGRRACVFDLTQVPSREPLSFFHGAAPSFLSCTRTYTWIRSQS
jgi:hypothetical protein